ncbi:very short patch repair endonuclease [Mycolicibacterium sp. 120270]|uniref:very short patch repair endonuclease n=1 Tax=Mycolicibacterium sp. 120270 TaxID=3090600 RepID=UPI00299E5990|nr:very short patch repair endonuclease [Mycolicibacterium sp. 120270]MDX1883241.1 very short patch repair endonuclease [Mycolicibacterium sp. 120270]
MKRRSPAALNELVSKQMSAMPTRNTGTELALRRALHQLGLRFRIQDRSLPGRPDVVFTRARIAVFVDGCFWHKCPTHGTAPKNNSEWWLAKLNENVARDRRNDSKLLELGWLPVHVWEHEDPDVSAESIKALWRERTDTTARHRPSSGCR